MCLHAAGIGHVGVTIAGADLDVVSSRLHQHSPGEWIVALAKKLVGIHDHAVALNDLYAHSLVIVSLIFLAERAAQHFVVGIESSLILDALPAGIVGAIKPAVSIKQAVGYHALLDVLAVYACFAGIHMAVSDGQLWFSPLISLMYDTLAHSHHVGVVYVHAFRAALGQDARVAFQDQTVADHKASALFLQVYGILCLRLCIPLAIKVHIADTAVAGIGAGNALCPVSQRMAVKVLGNANVMHVDGVFNVLINGIANVEGCACVGLRGDQSQIMHLEIGQIVGLLAGADHADSQLLVLHEPQHAHVTPVAFDGQMLLLAACCCDLGMQRINACWYVENSASHGDDIVDSLLEDRAVVRLCISYGTVGLDVDR